MSPTGQSTSRQYVVYMTILAASRSRAGTWHISEGWTASLSPNGSEPDVSGQWHPRPLRTGYVTSGAAALQPAALRGLDAGFEAAGGVEAFHD
jgi:hypothetical protein